MGNVLCLGEAASCILDCKKYQISIKSTRLFNVLVELPAILRGSRVEEKVQIGGAAVWLTSAAAKCICLLLDYEYNDMQISSDFLFSHALDAFQSYF